MYQCTDHCTQKLTVEQDATHSIDIVWTSYDVNDPNPNKIVCQNIKKAMRNLADMDPAAAVGDLTPATCLSGIFEPIPG